jgi:hypothetical protein
MKMPSRGAAGVISRLTLVTLALTVLSCASASKLAQRSERARVAGDPERAYVLALQARVKDANAPATRSALDEAAWALYERSRSAIRSRTAVGDTFEAAHRIVDLDRLRLRFAHDGVAPPQDPGFEAEEQVIREAGAARFYDLGLRSLKEDRPKDAWRQFTSVRSLIPRYRELDRMIARSWERAVTPVAILPFADQAGMPEYSAEMARAIHAQIAGRLDEPRFTFTRLVDPQLVYGRVSMAEAGQIDRARAIAIGRQLGARRVVWGRIWNLRSDTNTDRWSEDLWHEVADTDTGGKGRKVWVSVPFRAVSRVRMVHVDAEFEVLDTDDEEALDRRDAPREVIAHTAFSRQSISGDADDYRVAPPTYGRDRRESLEQRWKHCFGPYSVSQFIERCRDVSGRGSYRSDFRREFASRDHCVFLDDLPPAEDMAAMALDDVWKPVLESLAQLDSR